ncbi:conserved hypothetical protein [Ricinus communis]|uniref:Peptidase S9 prolyl oligopeptidase catalytic domain-containing protein n=1 Tax=Ricinus communis TaxID=3988 RepID=B9TAI5_RICCO|nr:conserved hypothetical protein [Ricinus communis]
MRFVLPLLATAIAATATAAPTPITLDQAMANPDWIGNPVESAWWGWDSRQVYFKQKRSGSAVRDTYQINGGAAKKVDDKQLANLDSADPVYNRERTRAILLRNGDLFERDLKTGALTQIVRGTTPAADAQYAADGNHVQFRVGTDWFSWSRAERLVSPVIGTVSAGGGNVTQLTDTRTADYKAREWIEPQIVPVPSTHGADPVWAKLYRPATLEPGKKYPVVMFVHGAGYLQNVTRRYPVYFREQMFHNLLVQKGYIVLDMDYRASLGYGRNWRTAIYRQMGHPELEDYIDGLNWMVANQQGDAKNVGIYGGSYGGFMTFMALLRAPDQFKSGAALRPVTDWTTYNHEYTANILNTPELDPEAYKVSSPIEYAGQLKGNLLIAHGMIDDNVFFQDSVRMAQRLIELKKDNWELAPYPLERHGFVHPESWYDEYRRIYQLFERTLK